MNLRLAIHDLRCGLHSGIPVCCIAWYLGPWRWMGYGRAPKLREWYFERIFKRGAFDHIGCPKCLLLRRPVVVRDCTCMQPDFWTRVILGINAV